MKNNRLDQLARCVVARERVPNDTQLVAYVVSSPESHPAQGELRAFLQQKLPHYMVPSGFDLREALPRTSTGKIDRNRLAEEQRQAVGAGD